MNPVLLSTAYLAPVQYYGYLYAAPQVWEERHEHYVKQSYRNRCVIATEAGAMPLTIPVEHLSGERRPIRDLRLSTHGRWQAVHWNALQSAYESSPYFEYYADDFRPLYERNFDFLVDFNAALQSVVLSLLDLSPRILLTEAYGEAPEGVDDLRLAIRPKNPLPDDRFSPAEYYQVFRHRTGFLPNLSIVDLLFNMGPETRIVLRDSMR